MILLQTQAQEDCEPFLELADLTDFAVQFRYDFPVQTERLNRAEVLAMVEALRNHVQGCIKDAEGAE